MHIILLPTLVKLIFALRQIKEVELNWRRHRGRTTVVYQYSSILYRLLQNIVVDSLNNAFVVFFPFLRQKIHAVVVFSLYLNDDYTSGFLPKLYQLNLFILIYHKEMLIQPEFNCRIERILIFVGNINREQRQAVNKCAVNCSANLSNMNIFDSGHGYVGEDSFLNH